MTTRAPDILIDRWAGGICPFETGWRKLMMWAFIVTDGLLFAGFLASYGYVIRDGVIHMEGPAEALIKDDNVRLSYLGGTLAERDRDLRLHGAHGR